MKYDFRHHPSDIAKAAQRYVDEIKSEKRKNTVGEVLNAFLRYLREDSSAVKELPDGRYALIHNWSTYYGCFDGFRKDMRRWLFFSRTARERYESVLRQWVRWAYREEYFDQEHFREYMTDLGVKVRDLGLSHRRRKNAAAPNNIVKFPARTFDKAITGEAIP